jgi:hypothetical protein
MPSRVSDIAERIRERRAIYNAAYDTDVRLLVREHGPAPVEAALALVEAEPEVETWDQRAHARRVAQGIARFFNEQREKEF